jgi:hypothetical protein
MCRSWIRDSGRDIYHVISYSSYISHNNNKNNNDNVDFSLIIASFTIAFSIISLKIIFLLHYNYHHKFGFEHGLFSFEP